MSITRILGSLAVLLGLITASSGQVYALDKEALAEALKSPQRDLSDRLRDSARKPVEVLDFLGVEAGMTVLDVYAAGGYFTVVLSRAVGINGRVYAQNTQRGLRFEEDRSEITQGEVLEGKIRDNNLLNVVRVDEPVTGMSIPPGSVDMVLISQVLHDYHNGSPTRTRNLLSAVMDVLKPGGVLGIIDHNGLSGQDNRRLHRMPREDAIAAVTDAGFVLAAESDLLANPQDNYRRSIFDPMLNRATDQFLLRFQKPD